MDRNSRRRVARLLIGIAAIALVSLVCAATVIMPLVLSLIPMTRPAFLTTNGSTADQLCIQIDQAEFWRTNDSAQSIQEQIESTVQFTVNGLPVQHDPREFIYTLTQAAKIDEQGNVIGSFGGPTHYCLSIDDRVLPDMFRWVSVSVTTSDGVSHYYAWTLSE